MRVLFSAPHRQTPHPCGRVVDRRSSSPTLPGQLGGGERRPGRGLPHDPIHNGLSLWRPVMPIDVCQVNLGRRLAVLTNGEFVPIAILLDDDGDETDDPAEAKEFLTVPDSAGKQWHETLDAYTGSATRH